MKRLILTFSAMIAGAASAEIVINEIHYDSQPKTDRAEFIELLNAGPEAVDLSGWHFSEGFTFAFPEGTTMAAGEYLILAESMSGYQRTFGSIFVGGLKAFGEFVEGSLANEGEAVVLRDASGEVRDRVDYGASFPWPVAPQGASTGPDEKGVSMELLHPALDNDLAGSWRAALQPTPGKANSVLRELGEVPPQLRQVSHEPEAPRSGEDVVIRVKATDPDGVAQVTLRYQVVEPGAYIRLTDAAYETEWTEVTMNDDGQGADAEAGDDTYSAVMPGTMNQHRHLVRYRLEAVDQLGNSVEVPYADDPQPNFAYFTYDGVPAWQGAVEPGSSPQITFSAETMNRIAVYHLLAVKGDIEAQQWGSSDREWYGTVVYDGEVYDHMTFSKRGRASRGQVGKEKWDWNFNRGHRFRARDNYGRRYDVDWREINVLPGTNPWWRNDLSTDGTILNEPVGFRLFQLIGSPASNTQYFQLRVIDDVQEAPANDQYGGDLWGLYIAIQDPDSRFLRERGLPDGNIYNWHGGGDVQKNQGKLSVTDQSDHRDFKAGLRSATPLEWWQAHLDLEAYFAFNSGNLVINNADMRPNDNMMSYYHPDGRCYPIPWDLDLTFEDAPHLGRGDTPAWENIYHVLRHPEVDVLYQNRIRELLSLLCNGEQSGMLVDEYARFVWVDVPEGERRRVVAISKDGSTVRVTTEDPHGLSTGDLATVEGVAEAIYNGDKEVTVVSEREFTYRGSLFAPAPEGEAVTVYKTPEAKPLVMMDQAMWDHHPRKRKKGIYYKNISGNASEDFKGYRDYMKAFLAPGGYGHELLASHQDAAKAPNTPVIEYVGGSDYAVDGLAFEVSDFSGGSIFSPQEFAAVQWRLAEVSLPGQEGFDPAEPRKYEIDAEWESEEIAPFVARQAIPVGVPRPGRHYSVRARMKNTAGHWSGWSAPLRFQAAAPDVAPLAEALVISEIMYHPREATAEERAKGYEEGDFEYIELWNRGGETLDLAEVRFTKGVDFDFAGSDRSAIAAGERLLLVSHQEAFLFRYGRGNKTFPIAGAYQGRLSNGGERLKLAYGAGIPIHDLSYDDAEPWPAGADGGGYALLARLRDGEDPGDPSSWTLTAQVDGSPGEGEEGGGLGFADWSGSVFTEDQLGDPAISGPMADPDGDGIPNWLEYGQGGQPLESDVFSVEMGGLGEGSVEVRHAYSGGSEVVVGYEWSADLRTWQDVTPLEVTLSGGKRRVTFAPNEISGFVRVRYAFSPGA